jgi:uncharacterized protein HemX
MLKELKPLVTIRRKNEATLPMLSVEQEALIRQVLQLRLERVKSRLILRNQVAYESELSAVQQWILQFCQQGDANVQGVLKSLKEMQSIQLNPALPDISGSLKSFRTFRTRKQPQEPAS